MPSPFLHDDGQNRAKYQAAKRWPAAVNNWGEMERWDFHVCKDSQMLRKELEWLNKESLKS
jgi:type III restriction enzyme